MFRTHDLAGRRRFKVKYLANAKEHLRGIPYQPKADDATFPRSLDFLLRTSG
jgi:hypothetical protein